MMVPVRCFSCGKVIGQDFEKYKELIKKKSAKEVFKELGVERECCKRMFLTSSEFIDELMQYQK